MTQQGNAERQVGEIRRFYIAARDSADRDEARRAIGPALGKGWALADDPSDVTAILAVDLDVDADMIESASKTLRLVGTLGPEVDASASTRGDVQVVTVPSMSQLSRTVVAEYTVAMILTLTWNVLAMARTTTEDPWVPGRDVPTLTDQQTYVYNWTDLPDAGFLHGKVVGIVGLGEIGAAVARMLAPFGVRLLYTQRHRLSAEDEHRLGVEWRTFDDLIRECDVVTLHHRLQVGPPDGNECQFGAREFAMMKPSAYLVNTARGRLIDEDALVAALRSGQIAGVGLDVFRYEPLPKDHPLFSLVGDKVILTPHIAAGSERESWLYALKTMMTAIGEEVAS